MHACLLYTYNKKVWGGFQFQYVSEDKLMKLSWSCSLTMNWWVSKEQMTYVGSKRHLRYVGFIWFVFHVLQLVLY